MTEKELNSADLVGTDSSEPSEPSEQKESADRTQRKVSAVPSGRLSRFMQISATAGRMALGGAAEKVRRLKDKGNETLAPALLTANNARLLASRLARLRGAAMKVGQMLSLEGDSVLPKEFAEALDILRSSAHQMPMSQVQEVMRGQLGKDWARLYASFDLTPMASASIGQVHRATLHDGREVAVKIQYPGVAESIESDVDNLRSLLALSRMLPGELDLDRITEEVKAELRAEVDYERELRKLEEYRAAAGESPDYFIPAAVPELSRSRVLTTELAPGKELMVWAQTASQAERNRAATQLFSIYLRELFDFSLMQTDPNPANYLYDGENQRLVLIDFGAARDVPDHIQDLYRTGFISVAENDRVGGGVVIDRLELIAKSNPQLAELAKEARDELVEISLLVAPLFEPGVHDFMEFNVGQLMQERSMQLKKYQEVLLPPAPEFLFFQRKMGGTYLLCRQLRAQVDLHSALAAHGLVEKVSPSENFEAASQNDEQPLDSPLS